LVDYLKKVYSGEITAMDKDLGVFFDWMKEQGVYDNTVIVISSDHGEEFFEHGGWWHGTTLFEEQIHVPLILKMPNQEMAGSRVPWQVRAIDVGPTMADLAGAPESPMWQGSSLVDTSMRMGLQALAEAEAAQEQAAAEAEADGADANTATDDAFDPSSLERLVYAQQNFEGYVLESVRSKGWKFIAASNPEGAGEEGDTRRVLPERSLFDMSGFSPDEQDNQAGTGLPVQGELENLARESAKTALEEAVGAVKTETSASEEERMRALGYIE
jgi:arylsulfatase A-like enzyme